MPFRGVFGNWLNGQAYRYNCLVNKLSGIYPLPARRMAMKDEYPGLYLPTTGRSQENIFTYPREKYDVVYTRVTGIFDSTPAGNYSAR